MRNKTLKDTWEASGFCSCPSHYKLGEKRKEKWKPVTTLHTQHVHISLLWVGWLLSGSPAETARWGPPPCEHRAPRSQRSAVPWGHGRQGHLVQSLPGHFSHWGLCVARSAHFSVFCFLIPVLDAEWKDRQIYCGSLNESGPTGSQGRPLLGGMAVME